MTLNDLIKDEVLAESFKDMTLNDLIKDEVLAELPKELKKKIFFLNNNKSFTTDMYNTYKVIKSSSTDKEKLINSKSMIYQQSRLFHSNITLQRAIDLTPHSVKFLNGGSYESIIYKLIPRFIYKNKPYEVWGNIFGKLYMILSPEDFLTSWNFPILSEFYSNFGFKGIIFGMLILGLLTKSLIFFTHSFNKSTLISSMGYIVIFNLFFQESNLSQSIGKMINQSSFFICLIFFILIINICIKKFKNEN
jgi:hypothetical protein